jgi:ankyrin repeat protein
MVVWNEVLWGAVADPVDWGVDDAKRALGNGADASTVCPNGRTALYLATFHNSPNTVKLLLKYGATATPHGTAISLFNLSVMHINPDMLYCLFTSGVLDALDESIFHEAMYKIAKSSIYYGESYVDELLHLMSLCITQAVKRGYKLSRMLNTPDRFSRTRALLHHAATSACIYLRVPLVQMLVDYGADVSHRDRDGHTAEDLARSEPNLEPNIDGLVVAILEKERIRTENLFAFAMGYHDRLGHASVVGGLDEEHIRVICQLVREAVEN